MNNNIMLYDVLLGGGTNIGPYWSRPPPHPHPRCGKGSLPGGGETKQNMVSYFPKQNKALLLLSKK